jgi:hypothetical protein
MTLEDWRLEEGLTYARLAELLSEKDQAVSAETVRRYCMPEEQSLSRIPDPPMLRKIFRVTQGKVTPNDFAGL